MSLLQQVKSNFGLSDLFGIVGVFGGIFLLNFIFGFFFTVFAISLFSFAFFYLGFGVVDTKASSTVVGDARAGEGAPRALTGIKKLKDYPIEGVTTLYESFLNGCKVNGDGKCIGIRKDDNEFTWRTYKEVRTQLTNIASSFIHLGLPEGDRVGIYSRNCAEWILAAEACSFSNLVSVAIYDTLGEENRVFVVQQSRIRVLFFFSNLYKNVIDLKHSDCETLKYAVVMDNVLTDAQREEAESVGLTIYTFSEFEKIGKDHPHDPRPPKPQDLAILMYTSGTTSRPKGVMITHGNMMSTVAGITDAINVTKEDAFLSFLPLAHILERAAESALLCHGAAIGYYQGDIRKLTSDVQKLKPTVYAGVPKVYQRVMNEIKKNIYSQPPSKQRLFEILFSVKKHALRTGLTTVVKILDVILFQKIKDALGGRVRVIVSGGAPLGGECHEFLKVCFSCPFVQGYGLTETCGAASISPLDLANPYEKSGLPMTCTNIKLVDSGKYSSAHNPPQGEVCITGPNITLGYYENEEKTAEVYKRDESGTVWFHTGDAGQWNPDGTLSIIGRTKDIFKLDGGEYIAPERLETIYAQSKFVSNIFIYGDSKRSEIVAIVVPEFSQAIDWAKKNGIEVKEAFAPPNCPPSLCSNKAFKQAIVDDFKSVAASARLQAFEALRLIQLDPLFWTPETQLVTSALKNKRPELYGKFEKELEALYK